VRVVWLGIVSAVVVCVAFGLIDGAMAYGDECDRKGATNGKCDTDGNGC
jgi:hypothetical protein